MLFRLTDRQTEEQTDIYGQTLWKQELSVLKHIKEGAITTDPDTQLCCPLWAQALMMSVFTEPNNNLNSSDFTFIFFIS